VAKRRVDTLLVERGLLPSRERAWAAVLAGEVLAQGRPVSTPGALVEEGEGLALKALPRYASRGGEKLEFALGYFGLDVKGAVVVDIGASTGGFTDCLLQHGARRAYAVDVGYGLLAYRLRQDPRVVAMERTNARYVRHLPEPVDLATIDVSFIGLEKVLPAVAGLLRPQGLILALFKPQFQARREEVGRGGVIRDPQLHAALLGRFVAWAAQAGFRLLGLVPSPLLGPAGNREFFLLLRPETSRCQVATLMSPAAWPSGEYQR